MQWSEMEMIRGGIHLMDEVRNSILNTQNLRYQTGNVSRQLDRQGWNSEERPEQAINVGMVTYR